MVSGSSAFDAGKFVACPMASRIDLPGDSSEHTLIRRWDEPPQNDALQFVVCPMPSRIDLPDDRSEQHPNTKVGRTSTKLDFVAVYGLHLT